MRWYKDPCLRACQEASYYANQYVEVSTYQWLFEDADEDVKQNESIREKATAALNKAVDGIRKLIQNVRDFIDNFIEKVKLSKEDRERYEKYCKENSSKKISVQDWKKMEEEYDRILKETEERIRAEEKAKAEEAAARQAEIEAFIAKKRDEVLAIGKSALTLIGIDVARKTADSNIATAKIIKSALADEENALNNTLRKYTNDAVVDNFKKQVNGSSRIFTLRRFKIFILDQKAKHAKDCAFNTMDEIKKMASGDVGTIAKSDLVRDVARMAAPDQNPNVTIAKAGANVAMTAHQLNTTKAKAKRKANDVKKTVADLKDFWVGKD